MNVTLLVKDIDVHGFFPIIKVVSDNIAVIFFLVVVMSGLSGKLESCQNCCYEIYGAQQMKWLIWGVKYRKR